jgi:hypothetical protein
MTEHSVILFFSNSYSIWTSKELKKRGINHKMIPVPRHLSSDCGYCVRINKNDAEMIQSILTEKGIEFDGIVAL